MGEGDSAKGSVVGLGSLDLLLLRKRLRMIADGIVLLELLALASLSSLHLVMADGRKPQERFQI